MTLQYRNLVAPGLRGPSLIVGAVGPKLTRATVVAIEAWLTTLDSLPGPNQAARWR